MAKMAEKDVRSEEAPPLARALSYFRQRRRWSPQRLAAAHGFAEHRQILGYESGDRPLSREYLEFLLAPLEVPPEAIDAFLYFDGLIDLDPPPAVSPSAGSLTREEQRSLDRAVLTAGWTMVEALRHQLAVQWKKEKVDEERRQARERWDVLKRADSRKRRDLIEVFAEYRTWALAELLCQESERRAAHRVDEALDLAETALLIAERVAEEEHWRSLLIAYCQAHVANALRVATDFERADEVFAQASKFWRAGEGYDPYPLDEWRMFDLESSLRREQHQFQAALDLLEKALGASGEDRTAKGRIFLKKEHVFNQMGDLQSALEALEKATPWVEAAGDPRLKLAHCFNRTDNLCRQERYAEAETLLDEVRALAVEQSNEIHLIRVMWLGSKIDAGQGRLRKAVAGLEQVRRDFTGRELPYEAALSSLDLALIWLKEGRRAEVRSLALAMGWIFKAKKIHREALASLTLFCEAAREDAATVELTQQVIAEIERVRRSAPRSGNGPGSRA
jgi:tetratricopeptide (TPR) repeat protein